MVVVAERFLALAPMQPGGEVPLMQLFTQESMQSGHEGAEKILQLSVLNILRVLAFHISCIHQG